MALHKGTPGTKQKNHKNVILALVFSLRILYIMKYSCSIHFNQISLKSYCCMNSQSN